MVAIRCSYVRKSLDSSENLYRSPRQYLRCKFLTKFLDNYRERLRMQLLVCDLFGSYTQISPLPCCLITAICTHSKNLYLEKIFIFLDKIPEYQETTNTIFALQYLRLFHLNWTVVLMLVARVTNVKTICHLCHFQNLFWRR
jgi:hypothetical protein